MKEAIAPKPSERLTRRKIPQPYAAKKVGRVPAWLVSIAFHITVLTTIAAVWKARPNGTGQEVGGPVGVAVVYESAAGGEEYFLTSASAAASAASAEALANSLPSEAAAGSPQEAILNGLLPAGDGPAGDLLAAAGGLSLAEGQAEVGSSGKIPKVKTTVFGIEGEGTRFVYVFDRSDSMNGFEGLPLRTAKSELLSSISSLGSAHQFQIIFYNDTPLPYGGLSERGPQMLRGDEQSKLEAQRFVKSVGAIGGTQHIDALRMALAMGPDVIFFLTDADFPAPSNRDIESVHSRAARSSTTIHTIQFGSGANQGGGAWIEHLAEGTLGKYRYVDVSKF